MDKKKFAVRFEFTGTVEGDYAADALAHAAYGLHYSTIKDVRNISMKVCSEIREKRAIAEAPYADQVTVHESDGEVEQPPAPTITLLAPDEDGSGLPPVSTQTAELTAAYTRPDPDEIPF